MKIMFHIDTLGKGGAERVISVLSNELVKSNDVIIALKSKNSIAYNLNPYIKLYEIDDNKKSNFLKRNYGRLRAIYQIEKNEKPDIIISFLPMSSFRILFLKHMTNIPVIVSVRNDPNEEYKRKIDKFLMRFLYKRADGFVFQTEMQKEYFSQKIQNKSTVIYNPIKKEFLAELNKPIIREKKIVSVGRLDAQKNRKMLIDAFSKIHNDFPDYKLVIYGIGNLKDEIEDQILSLGLQEYVKLPGIKDNIKGEIYNSSMFVLSSDYEGIPNALIEAMALGIPCISTDCPCGGPKSFIKNYENGILTEVDNSDMLADKMREILSDNDLANRLGENASKIKDILNPEKINFEWEEYIKFVYNKNVKNENR